VQSRQVVSGAPEREADRAYGVSPVLYLMRVTGSVAGRLGTGKPPVGEHLLHYLDF
jgi:hypothetical protein